MKTWHYIAIGGVLLYLWGQRTEVRQDGATPPPDEVTGIASSLSGLLPRAKAALNLYGLRSDRRFG